MTTSSRDYNIIALRGGPVTDQEYVDTFGLDPALANTPGINDAMLDRVYQENVEAGVDEKKAKQNRSHAARTIKKLMAENGYL